MTRVAIVAAFPGELKPLLNSKAKQGWQHEKRGRVDLWRRSDDRGEWIAACAGAGQHAATLAFAEIERDGALDGPIDLIISTGWAGGLHPVIEAGRAYSACGVIDAKTGEMTPTANWDHDIWLVTSPVVANEMEKHRLAETYDAGLVDMEAAAIARLASMRNIRFYCIKGVSDGLSDRLPDLNRFIGADGRLKLARLIFYVLLRPWLWHSMMRMGENSRKAAEAIAESLLELLNHI